jgi:hypothetical protein
VDESEFLGGSSMRFGFLVDCYVLEYILLHKHFNETIQKINLWRFIKLQKYDIKNKKNNSIFKKETNSMPTYIF